MLFKKKTTDLFQTELTVYLYLVFSLALVVITRKKKQNSSGVRVLTSTIRGHQPYSLFTQCLLTDRPCLPNALESSEQFE